MRRRGQVAVRLTGRGWCLTGAGLAGLALALVFDRRDLLLVGLALVISVAASWLVGRFGRNRLDLRRQLPVAPVACGVRLPVVFHSPGPGLRARDWPAVVDVTPTGVMRTGRAEVAGHSPALVYWLGLGARGAWRIGPALSQHLSPLGVACVRRVVCPPGQVLVSPRLIHVPLSPFPAESQERETLLGRAGPLELDPISVRPYQVGDPRSRVHWRSTARRAELMVRQDRPRSNTTVWLVVDTTQAGSARQVELAISAAASALIRLMAKGHPVQVMTTFGQVLGPYGLGDQDLALADFARLQVRSGPEPNWVAALADQLPLREGETPVLVVLGHAGGSRTQALDRLANLTGPPQALLVGPAAALAGTLTANGWQVNLVRADVT
ncbi:MAG: DUF58 domain-containing protein [Micrococcales bacterium]|nr:DUF58 domain-containing protein [Micrococcales bacterium]